MRPARTLLLLAVAATVIVRALWPHHAPQWLTWLALALLVAFFAVSAFMPWPHGGRGAGGR